jgi:hypothetical protein
MGDTEKDPTAAEGATTPAPAEPAGSTTPPAEPSKTEMPSIGGDPWEDFGKEEPDKPDDKKTTDVDKSDESKEKKEDGEEPDDEEKAIAEAFDEDDKPDEKKAEKPKEPTEEDVDKQDAEEMLKSQRNATAKSYLQRAERVYAPAKDFKYGNIPVAEFHDKLSDFIGDEKTGELASFEAHRLVDENPDIAFHRIYALKQLSRDPDWQYSPDKVPNLDEIVFGNGKVETPAAAKRAETASPTPKDLAELTRDLDSVIDFNWRDEKNDDQFVDEREMKMAQTIRGLEAKAIAEGQIKSELSEKLASLEKNVEKINETGKTEEQKKLLAELDRVGNDYQKVIEEKFTPHIRRTTGLEVHRDDTPEVAEFKKRKMELFVGDDYQRANGFASRFEAFVSNESSVAAAYRQTVENVVAIQKKEAAAILEGKAADAKKYHDEAAGFLLTFSHLFSQATKEFRKKFVDPDIELLGIRAKKVADPILNAAKRKETVSTGGGTHTTQKQKREYQTADDLWNAMPEEAASDERAARAS